MCVQLHWRCTTTVCNNTHTYFCNKYESISLHANSFTNSMLSCSQAVQYVGQSWPAVEAYLCGVWSGSGRLPDRVQTASPSGCGWPCTGPLERHTPAAAPSSRSTPSCLPLWLYILHADAAREPQRHTQWDFILIHFFFSSTHVQLPLVLCPQSSADGRWAALCGAVRSLCSRALKQ